MIDYQNLLQEIKSINNRNITLIAIDGVAGSGKTTLALKLAKDLADVSVVHMDDLYDGWNNPLSQKLTARVMSQLLEPASKQLSVIYQIFDWKLNRFTEYKTIPQSKYLILEGVGAAQREFRPYINKIIWIECDPNLGFNRVIARDGEQVEQEMIKFLIDQNNHFLMELSKNVADYTLNGAP
jgi:uridine kinase